MSYKNIIPKNNNEGSLGNSTNIWASCYFDQAIFNSSIEINSSTLDVSAGSELQFNGNPLALRQNIPQNTSDLNNDENFVSSVGAQVTGIYKIAQADYDNLATKDPLTLYIIT